MFCRSRAAFVVLVYDFVFFGYLVSALYRKTYTKCKLLVNYLNFWGDWCLDLSVECLDLSFGCLDLSFGCLDLSVAGLELSFGCQELRYVRLRCF